MKIALFGGTFDPIHRGHVTVARAALHKFGLKQIWFVPADVPPHKRKVPITSFYHRYAMTCLALAEDREFLPSLLEAPDIDHRDGHKPKPSYTIDTVRRVKTMLGKNDRLYFLIGMDAFKDIAQWQESEELLRACEFIVAARPGYSLADVASSLPAALRPEASIIRLFKNQKIEGPLVLPDVTLHLLPETHVEVSATQIRAAVTRGSALKKLVPDAVAEYIHKQRLYRKPATHNS